MLCIHSLPLVFESPMLTAEIKKTGIARAVRELTRALRLGSELPDLRAG